VRVYSTFLNNRICLLDSDTAARILSAILDQPDVRPPVERAFQGDGKPVEAFTFAAAHNLIRLPKLLTMPA